MVNRSNFKKTEEAVEGIRQKRALNDKTLTESVDNLEKGHSQLADWANNECSYALSYIEELREYCKDMISTILLDESKKEIEAIQNEIETLMSGVFGTPEDDPMGLPAHILRISRSYQNLLGFHFSLYRTRITLERVFDVISTIQKSKNKAKNV